MWLILIGVIVVIIVIIAGKFVCMSVVCVLPTAEPVMSDLPRDSQCVCFDCPPPPPNSLTSSSNERAFSLKVNLHYGQVFGSSGFS